MPTAKRPRRGSLQVYPRKRASKRLHRVNFKPVSKTNKEQGLLGFIAYKVGMTTALVKDNTEKVRTAKKQIAMPVTVLEVPNMKVFSVRFHNKGRIIKDVVVSNDKELKRKLKVPKTPSKLEGNIPDQYDDISIIVYSLPKLTSIKKTPDLTELAINADDKLEYVKSLLGKEITLENLAKTNLLDVRGVTTGKGTQGPVKRFGITLRFHKSEKGVRKVGSIGPWHPARVMFRVPMAGQLGLFSRIIYNLPLLNSGKIAENNINPKQGWKNYGNIKTNYLILSGSVQGPSKRQLVVTPAFRPSKLQSKKKLEFIQLMN